MFDKVFIMLKGFPVWLKKSPLNILIAAVTFIAVIVGLVLFFRFVFPTLCLIVFFAIIFLPSGMVKLPNEPKCLPNLEDENVRIQVIQLIYKAIISVKSAFVSDIVIPDTPNDMYEELNCLQQYHGVPMLVLFLLRQNKDKEIDCVYYKKSLQRAINARLRDGFLRDCPWAIPAHEKVPLIKIVAVTCSDMYVYIDILLTNNAKSIRAAQLAEKPEPRKTTKDTKPSTSSDFDKIPFMLDETAYRLDLLKWLELDYKAAPHVLWCGRTGSGKTVAAKLLLARTALLAPPHFQPVEISLMEKGVTLLALINFGKLIDILALPSLAPTSPYFIPC